jgi:hypothetical protein
MEQRLKVLRGGTPAPIWWSLIAGFLAFGLDLGFGYVLQRHACNQGRSLILHLITIICFVIALSGMIPAIFAYRQLPSDKSEKGEGQPASRVSFQAILGIAFSIAFAVAIVAVSVPPWILDPCS